MKFLIVLSAVAIIASPIARADTLTALDGTPAEIADWVLGEMTCFEFMAIGGTPEGSGFTKGNYATFIALSYLKGVAKASGTNEGDLNVAVTLTCMGHEKMRFVDAPFVGD